MAVGVYGADPKGLSNAGAVYTFDLSDYIPNQAPKDLNFTAPLTIAENQPVGTVVGEFNATDPEVQASINSMRSQVERITIGGNIADGDEFFLTLTEQNGLLETESVSPISITALASDEAAPDPQSSIRDRLVSEINNAAGTYLTASALGTNQISIVSKQSGDPFLLSNVGSSGSAGSITQVQTVANVNNDAEERLVSIDFKHDTKNTGVALKVGDKISVTINGGNYEYAATQADLNAINGTLVGDTLSNPQNYGAAALRMANGLAGVINAASATNNANVNQALPVLNTLNGASFQVRSTERGNDLAIAGTGAVTISQAEVLPTATTFNFSLSDPARTLKTGDRIQIDRDGSMVTFNYNGGGATGFTSWNDLATKMGNHSWFQSATVAGNTMTVTAAVEDINVQPNFRVRQIQTDDAGSVLTSPTHSGGMFVKQANWANVGTTGGSNSGLSLDLTVNNTNGQLSSVAVNTSGNGYVEGQTLSIPAGQLDGANSIQIRVDDVRGQMNGISSASAGQARGSYSYNGVNTSTTTSPTGGSGATLNITSDAGGNITSAIIVGGGTQYAVGNEFTVATADIGGGDATLATFQVTGVNAGTGAVTTVALVSGNAKSNNLFSGITSTSNGAGTGGTFNISTNNDGTISGVAINGSGNNYRFGEEITIAAADLGGGTAADVKFTINSLVAGTSTVNAVSYQSGNAKMSFADNGVTTTGGSGSGLALDITSNRLGAVTAVNVNSNGKNYAGGDSVTINGESYRRSFWN